MPGSDDSPLPFRSSPAQNARPAALSTSLSERCLINGAAQLTLFTHIEDRLNVLRRHRLALGLVVLANASFLAFPAFVIASNPSPSISIFEVIGLLIWVALFPPPQLLC